jgi:acetylcholinesterase
MAFALVTLLGLLRLQTVGALNCLDIDTTSGPVKGFISETTPDVAQFLGIPFAEPPVGARRWLLAVPKAREERVINATHFGPSCPQWATDVNVEANVYPNGFPNFTPSPLDYLSEDCFSLNIWAPYQREKSGSRDKKRLPVIVWLYGGGYTTGGGNVPYQNPEPWVQKSGKHIVVSLK